MRCVVTDVCARKSLHSSAVAGTKNNDSKRMMKTTTIAAAEAAEAAEAATATSTAKA